MISIEAFFEMNHTKGYCEFNSANIVATKIDGDAIGLTDFEEISNYLNDVPHDKFHADKWYAFDMKRLPYTSDPNQPQELWDYDKFELLN